MNIVEKKKDGVEYYVVGSEEIVIRDEASALDLIGELYYAEDKNVIIPIEAIEDEFWDLKTTVAGNVFQKFVQYEIVVAVLGNIENAGTSLKAFIRESNRGTNLFFVETEEEAVEKFS